MLKTTSVCLACLLFAFGLPSCNSKDTGGRNAPSLQEAEAGGTENAASGTVQAEIPENPQTVPVAATLTALTLVRSVEPEQLRNVMPNSWRKLERLTEAEEREFVVSHNHALAEIERHMSGRRGWQGDIHYFAIYRQQIGTDAFYRIIVTPTDNPDFMSRTIAFNQFLIYQNDLLLGGFAPTSYVYTDPTQFGSEIVFSSVDIIQNGDKAIGVLLSNVRLGGYVDDWGAMGYGDSFDWSKSSYLERRNGQLYGSVEAEYFPFNIALREDRRSFEIRSDNVLVDPDSPLRYGIQNAFDGNPSTTFVPNFEGSILEIMVSNAYLPSEITKIAIINGFAENFTVYTNNNRIKSIKPHISRGEEIDALELAGNTLAWQVVDISSYGFRALEIYPGEKYNLTGISGFNLYLEDSGWLFGDIDE